MELHFSVIVPCFNEELAIKHTVHSLRKHLGDSDSYELIVVNDGSTDQSEEILATLAKEDSSLRIFHHDDNQGYGAALKSGIRKARSELIVITDADGTYPSEKIPDLVQLIDQEDADMVVGSRTGEDVHHRPFRSLPMMFLRRYASWIAGRNIPDLNSGLRVFRKPVADRFFDLLPDGFSFTTTITLSMLTNFFDVRYFPINYAKRMGTSKIKPVRDTVNFLALIVRVGVYFAPLRVFAPIGLILGVGSFASLSYDLMILNNLTEKTLILFVFFVNIMMFAILAEMIDRRGGR